MASEHGQRARPELGFHADRRTKGKRACPDTRPAFPTFKPSSAASVSYVFPGGGPSMHGGREGGQIKAQAAPLALGDGSDGWRVQEALVRATARSRAWSRSKVAAEAVTAARSCSRRSVDSLGGGCGHGVPLHSCPPWAARAPGQVLGTASVSLRARMPRRESSVSSCQRQNNRKAER